MMRGWSWLVALSIGACGGASGTGPLTPVTVEVVPDPRIAFEATLATLRLGGYNVVEMDEQRLFLRVESRHSGTVVATRGFWGGSVEAQAQDIWLSFQVTDEGRLRVIPSGSYGDFRDKVAREMQGLIQTIRHNARTLAGQRAGGGVPR